MAQFQKMNLSRGAPMGRSESPLGDAPRSIRLFRVNLDSGGYDDGGAYWGRGAPLYCAQCDEGGRQFVRAASRNRAALMLGIATWRLKATPAGWLHYGRNVLDGRAPMPEGVTRDDVIAWLKDCGVPMGQPTKGE